MKKDFYAKPAWEEEMNSRISYNKLNISRLKNMKSKTEVKVSKYYIRENSELECFQIMEKNGIISDEGNDDAVVADIYDWNEFWKYVEEVRITPMEENVYDSLIKQVEDMPNKIKELLEEKVNT